MPGPSTAPDVFQGEIDNDTALPNVDEAATGSVRDEDEDEDKDDDEDEDALASLLPALPGGSGNKQPHRRESQGDNIVRQRNKVMVPNF